MKHSSFLSICLTGAMALAVSSESSAGNLYVKGSGGLSLLSDKTFGGNSSANGSFDKGFSAVGAVGYQLNPRISAELAYQHTENDFEDNRDGGYKADVAFLNGYYYFKPVDMLKVQPYIGAGIGIVDNVEVEVGSTTYEAEGEFAYQIIGGLSYPVSKQVNVLAEAHYMDVSKFDLERTNGSQKLTNAEYDPLTFTIGARVNF